MIDVSAFRMLLLVVTGWLDRRARDAIAYLVEENRLLHRQLGGRHLRLTDADRRRLAALAHRLGRRVLRDVATVVTPDTLLRWHRQLIAWNWTSGPRTSQRDVLAEIRHLVVRMADEKPTWDYTLSVIGLNAVTAYAVAQRTREIGIRMALGARSLHVMSLVLRGAAKQLVIGLAVGFACTATWQRLFGDPGQPYRLTNPLVLSSVAGLVMATALLACFGPARRASALNPVEALRGK